MERLFLEHTHRLVQHGVLVFVIPFDQLNDCAGILSANFTRLSAFRMMDPESCASAKLSSSVCGAMFGAQPTKRAYDGRERLRLTKGMRGCLNSKQKSSNPSLCLDPAKRL